MGGQKPETNKNKISVGLLAHVDAGKTTLSEALLYLTGAIRKMGRVDDRDAFLDTYELERERGITIFSKQAVFDLGDKNITLLDTPGHVDFSAEMERTIQVLDAAILVVSGADGVQGHTRTVWRLLKRHHVPVFLFINKMDQSGCDPAALMKDLKTNLDGNCVDFGGWSGEKGEWGLEKTQSDEFYQELAVCDEKIMESYFENGVISTEEIGQLVRERKVFPCYFGSALKLKGVEKLIGGITLYGTGVDTGKEEEPFGAKVFKISRDNQGNRLTHLKVTSGVLHVKDCWGEEEKVNQIRIYSGAKFESVKEASAGCICAVTGPLHTHPGQGIGSEPASELPMLEPVLTYRILLPFDSDVHKCLQQFKQLEEEEPELHVLWNEELGEIQVQLMGDVQIEILKHMLEERYGLLAGFDTGNIVYKETILNTVEGVGHFEPLRHYAEVHLLLEPGEPGSGLQFDTVCSEDVLDRNWQRLILTHLEEKLHRGVLTGAEITDMKVTLLTGRAHMKHTEGGDFRQATYRALRQGLMQAESQLLEPFYGFTLELPAENLGRAMADMDRMFGTFEPPVTTEDGVILTGKAPVASLRDYQREVIAYTKGRGHLNLWFKDYEPCHNAEEVIEAAGYDPEADLENTADSVFCSHGAGYLVPWYQVKEYMHVESPLEKLGRRVNGANEADGAEASVGKIAGGKRQSSSDPGTSWSDDKELEEIFNRRFGPGKWRSRPDTQSSCTAPRTRNYSADKSLKGKETKKPEEEEYLLVDGYNIIFAWEELRELSKVTIDGARQKLMDILCNYQGYKKCTLILVFDAYKVTGNTGEAINYHNIHVVYTKEAETADQYIEKLAHKIGRQYHVTVATSDGLEQLIIYGQGCHLMSARDLKEEVAWANEQIREEKAKLKKNGKNYLFHGADEELAAYLEDIRLGRRE
jgi:ribosomal protection tetracycline resistance protein